MKKLILICLCVLMTASCSSGVNTVFKENIVPDFEQIVSGDNEVFEAYENAAAAARAYVGNPTDETRAAFLAAAEESDETARKYASIQSHAGNEEYAVMDRLNLPRTDFDYLFEAQPSSMAELSGWSVVTEQANENFDADTLEHLILTQEYKLELEKVYLVYGAMDWVVDTDKTDAEYFRDMIYKYPHIMPDGCEWLTDHEEIADAYNARLDDIEERINEEQEYMNELTRKLRQEQND